MPKTLSSLESELRGVVARGVRDGRSPQEISAEVSRRIAAAGIAADTAQTLMNSAQQQQRFLAGARMPAPNRNRLANIAARGANGIARVTGTLQRTLADTIARGIRAEQTTEQLQRALSRRMDVAKHHVATIANTALGAYSRLATVDGAEQVGITRFRYAGPRGEREFCRKHVGQVYTVVEIAGMDNGQGLSVREYCGGYNCRHHWEPVLDEPTTAPQQQDLTFHEPTEQDALSGRMFTGNAQVFTQLGTRSLEMDILDQPLGNRERIRLCGAPDGAEIDIRQTVSRTGQPGMVFIVDHPQYTQDSHRVIYRNDDDELEMYNAILTLQPDAPDGLGARIFATQVAQARALGVRRIVVHAAGRYGSGWAGYYTWPRFGYDGDIPADVVTQLPPSLWYARRISDLMTTVEGRQVWLLYGHEVDLYFDLADGSLSMVILTNYLKQAGIRL